MEYIDTKHLLSPVKFDGNKWFGIDYIMNLYKGCNHGCIYCDSRSNKYHIDNFDKVKLKRNIETILYYELKKYKKGIINLGAMSDSYNNIEKKYLATRNALQIIEKFGYGLSVETKSDLIIRDIDVIYEISKKSSALVKFSISSSDDHISKLIEPNVCCTSERLKAVEKLSGKSLIVGVLIAPVLPFITDAEDNISNIIERAYQHGANFIYTKLGMTMRTGQREYYYKCLDEKFPHLKSKYMRTYRENYLCNPLNIKKLEYIVAEQCDHFGLAYKMNDIIKLYKKPENNIQLELF
jgi:DNA repair photolyase